jgi:TatD DNase family protein
MEKIAMFLVDSHCHLDQLDLASYDGKLANALTYAEKQGIGHMLCVCITLKDFPQMLKIAESYSQVSASVGLHPNEEAIGQEPSADDIIKLANHQKVVAIGETGLDYYRSQGDLTWQHERFRQHIRAAKAIKKPLIVHTRQAKEDTLKILKEENAVSIGGVMHCFTEDWQMAQAAMNLNFYISFSGIVTFKNSVQLQAVAKQVPLDRMLLETDAPYLAPVPYRGRPNEPAYVRNVAEFIAELRGIDIAKLAEQTTANFFKCFQTAGK